MRICKKGRLLGISVAIAHGIFSGSLNILLKFLISKYNFFYLTLIQWLTGFTAALTLEILRRLKVIDVPPFSLGLAKTFICVTILSTFQSTFTLWSLKGLSLPMYVVFKRCLPFVTLIIGVFLLRNGIPSIGVIIAVLITTCGAALAGAGDLTGDAIGYMTGVLAVIVHATYLVMIQKAGTESDYGPLTAQYAIAVTASPVLLICFATMDSINAWSFPGWKDPVMACTFVVCIVIGCAMNFTTLHCTYINSAVTTSFVGVVKSIATITVGMVAFSDVEPTTLFIAGVVVNTVGSITYCVVKYFETKKQERYENLENEQDTNAGEPTGETFTTNESGAGGAPEIVANGTVGELQKVEDQAETKQMNGRVEALEIKEEEGPTMEENKRTSVTDAYVGVWRLIKSVRFRKKDYLIENEELQSP
ncbi:solute carrier family 35 member D3 [Latimeria chalumnae]|uniref:Solute carrier family 35 member D3 n=1 Tax=Latimeria chalumnae TaxID=7897 RepID=H2ZXI4_LATCH|nr:PREDICTED: solute carrier family 35 member D3 [Latimeria chalumnae]|eukprot:XP_006014023.1 PREDICTED: solute carrier family 35 member D3 [Latimeria chalumnae]